jgi:septum site-determining protein MinC
MSQAVIIKSNKYGIHLILDKDMPFSELMDAIIAKFKESEKFFKNARVGISFEGRNLSTEEEQEIIQTVTENTSIDILCVVDTNPEHEEQVRQQIESYQAALQHPYMDAGTQFFRGTLRSGQTLQSESGIVVVGDVNPGATVSASGSIVVLGAIKGNVYAGINGDDSTFIAAMDLDPIQIGIGNLLAKSPDKTFEKKLFRRKPKETTGNLQIAYCKDGTICIEPMTKETLSDI